MKTSDVPSPLTRRRQFIRNAAAFAAAAALPRFAQARNDAPAKTLRLGIAGGGPFGLLFRWHGQPGCTVAAVADLIPDRHARLMKACRCDKAYPSLEEMVKDPDLDAIGVFTDGTRHFDHAMLALAHGKHVVSAAPAVMAHTAEEGLDQAYRLFEKVKQTGLTYMMAEASCFQRQTISVRKLYEAGALGRITCCESDYFHPGLRKGYGTAENPAWRYGVPPMFDATRNTMHLMGVTGERLVAVACSGWGDDDPILKKNAFNNNPFWNENANFISDRGTPFRVRVCWQAPGREALSARWFGTRMTATLPEPLRHASGHEGACALLAHEFVDAVNKGRRPAVDIHEAIAWTVPGIIAHQSALKGGEMLRIPQFARTV